MICEVCGKNDPRMNLSGFYVVQKGRARKGVCGPCKDALTQVGWRLVSQAK